MKPYALCILFLCAALQSCNNPKPAAPAATANSTPPDTTRVAAAPVAVPIAYSPDLEKEQAALQHKLEKLSTPSQHLTASAKAPSIVRGALGSRILVVPKDMVTPEGQPVTEDIDVELKEMPGVEQMLMQGAQTMSNGRLLASGGAYYINMTSGGQQLSLKLNKTMKVLLPKNTDQQMKLFYGNKDEDGVMNWTPTPQQFKNFDVDSSAFLFAGTNTTSYFSAYECRGAVSKDLIAQLKKIEELASLFDEKPSLRDTTPVKAQKTLKRYETLANTIYNEIIVQKFGWINCDRFLGSQTVTTLACGFDPKDSIPYAKIYLVFKSINSLMEEQYAYNTGASFRNVPTGMQATVIAIAMKKGKLFTSRKDVEIDKRHAVILSMKPTKDNDVAALFKI